MDNTSLQTILSSIYTIPQELVQSDLFPALAKQMHWHFDGRTNSLTMYATSQSNPYEEVDVASYHGYYALIEDLRIRTGVPSRFKLEADGYNVDRLPNTYHFYATVRPIAWVRYITEGFAKEDVYLHIAPPDDRSPLVFYEEYRAMCEQFSAHIIVGTHWGEALYTEDCLT